MAPQGEIQGTWKSNDHEIEVHLPFIIFEQESVSVVYCPALDISGYGINELEAFKSFEVNLGEFLLYTNHKGTFISELKRMGWTVKASKYKPMVPPSMSKLLEENDNFSNIFNSYPFRKINHPVSLPA
ncbi:MAG: hypothetical protein RBS55_03875 [Bacteroidales bacterium]|jgi:hypothetical protein|nr:hypothetical protein [Bacteroidales bacterium]